MNNYEKMSLATQRIRAAQSALEKEGMDALLLINSTNMIYLSGYPNSEITLSRPFYLILPKKGDPVLLVHVARKMEASLYSWVSDIRVYSRLSFAPIEELEKILKDLNLWGKRIGCELGYEQRLGLPFLEFERIRASLTPSEFIDASKLLWDLRMKKSTYEVDAIREACRITSEAYNAVFSKMRLGDHDADVEYRFKQETMDQGGSTPWIVLTSGKGNYDLATGSVVGRLFEPGDMVWIDGGCSVKGFWSDFSRAAIIGSPTKAQLEAQEIIHNITQMGVNMCMEGVKVSKIAQYCNEKLEEIGFPITSSISGLAGRIGHGLGIDITEPPSVAEFDNTILANGMVITIEPGVATEYGIFHVEENVYITPNGPDILSKAPWQLYEVKIQ